MKALKIIGILVFALLFGLLDAKILSDLWRWFAVPALSVRPISIGSAFGLNLLVIVFTAKARPQPDHQAMWNMVASVLFAWGIGYVAHLCNAL